jgi:hypothetical protein
MPKPPAKMASIHETGVGDVLMVSRRSRGINHGALCGLLMERLCDVSVCLVCVASLFLATCVYDLYVCSKQDISLTKAAEKIMIEDEIDDLRRCMARLEEENF